MTSCVQFHEAAVPRLFLVFLFSRFLCPYIVMHSCVLLSIQSLDPLFIMYIFVDDTADTMHVRYSEAGGDAFELILSTGNYVARVAGTGRYGLPCGQWRKNLFHTTDTSALLPDRACHQLDCESCCGVVLGWDAQSLRTCTLPIRLLSNTPV